MADPHWIRSTERDGSCMYCSKKLNKEKWTSSFSSGSHYKCVVCSCGKTNCVSMNFIGTGHDSWSGLEKKVVKSGSVTVLEKNVRILK